jgi:DNA adenine methylase
MKTPDDVSLTPLVKWAGGKRQLQSILLPLIKHDVDFETASYFEPFFGGGAMFLALKPQRGHLSDLNSGLVNVYKTVRDEPRQFGIKLREYEAKYNALSLDEAKHFFLSERSRFNSEERAGLDMAARFVFLNKAGFNGMYRENASGAFNIPFGKRTGISLGTQSNIDAVSVALKPVSIHVQDFRATVDTAVAGDVVYFDPPYAPLTATSSFTGYTADGFDGKDQESLRDLALELTNRQVRVVISNSSAEHISNLYQEFEIMRVTASRAVSASSKGRAPVTEFVITNFGLLK